MMSRMMKVLAGVVCGLSFVIIILGGLLLIGSHALVMALTNSVMR